MEAMASTGDGGDLVQRAARDSEALGRLYDRHYPGVLRYCVHRLFVREAAEDVTSEVFLEVARCIRGFTGRTERDFGNWLYAIATNQVNAYLRKASRRKALLASAARQRRIGLGGSSGGQDCPDWATLYEAIAALSPRQQAIVTLRSFENLPYEQIAAVLGIKPVAARVAFSRALKKLRARLPSSMGSA